MVAKTRVKTRVPACQDAECVAEGRAQDDSTAHTVYFRPMRPESYHELKALAGAYGISMPELLERLASLRRRLLEDPKLCHVAEDEGLRRLSI